MSGSNSGIKPPQSGLVDMGDISFYNDPSDPTPSFTISDLENNGTAIFGNAISEIVLNVTWAQLEPLQGTLDIAAIQNAISLVGQYNSNNHTDLGIKLRVWGGYTAPAWAQAIDGPPVTVSGAGTVNPHHDQVQTIGRFWSADYIDAWTSFQQQLAAAYDNNPLIRGISNTAGAAATDEPFVPLDPNQVAELVSGGYTNAAEQLTLRAAISDYTSWTTTPLDYTMNLFHLEDNGKVTGDADFTLAVLQAAVTSSRIVQAGNHALNNPLPDADAFVYAQMAAYDELDPSTPSGSYQTASPVNLGTVSNWGSAVSQGLTAHAGDIELWDGPGNTGFTGIPGSVSVVENLATLLAAGLPPVTGTPDNGAALQFIAPASVREATGRIALTGVDAVLLASVPGATSYTVTIVSTGGHTLSVTNFATLAGGMASGSTLSFAGSPDQVNTTLSSLTDTLIQAGTDVLAFTASDNTGASATRAVGVVAVTSTGTTSTAGGPVLPAVSGSGTTYTWVGSGTDALFSNAANWSPSGPPGASDTALFNSTTNLIAVAGTGTIASQIVDTIVAPGGGSALTVGQTGTGDADIADKIGTTGALILGGVKTSLTIAGNLEIGGSTNGAGGFGSLLAALSPSAYSTTNLTVGGTVQVWDHGTVRWSGALTAAAIDIAGGVISGDGTLTTGGTSIANNGVIEAVADHTLGLQQLTLADSVIGTGELIVDPGATLILNGSVGAQQTIAFASNSITQFSNDPYSPSTLELDSPFVTQGSTATQNFSGTITGFTFADELVLNDFSASASPIYSGGTLTIVSAGTETLSFAMPGILNHLTPEATVNTVGTINTTTTITFVAAGLGQLPSITAPATVQAETGAAVIIPDIVLQTPLPANPNNNDTVTVTVSANKGTLSAESNNNNTTVTNLDGSQLVILSGSLGSVERSLQTMEYQSDIAGTDTLTLTVSDYFGMSAQTTIAINIGTTAASFVWAAPSDGDFADTADWKTSGTTANSPPGGGDFAVFNNGTSSPYTVTGDGAVGRIVVADTVAFTGQILAQGLGNEALKVDSSAGAGGVLTLTGGAVLTAEQTAIVGETNQGVVTLMGGALDLTNSATSTALIIGDNAGSDGTVLNFEQIAALGTIVVGAAGNGTIRLLGAAATVSDGAADIGQSASARGVAVVDGGFWSNSGQLTVGDVGIGSLLIGGAANNITGQVTALEAVIGAQAGGSGIVTLDSGDFLVANAATAETSTLIVGDAGHGTLAINGGNVTVGAPLVNNGSTIYNGILSVGSATGGTGVISIDDDGSLLVEGDAVIGNGGTGLVNVGTSAIDTALFAMTGSLMIGADGQIVLNGSDATVRAVDIVIAAGGVLAGAGTVSGVGGGNSTVTLTSIDNAGTITASNGDLLIYGGVNGTGTLAIDTNATITLQAAVSAGQTLAFGSKALAMLDDVMAFSGTITGFVGSDTLDLASTDATSASWANNVLSLVTNTGTIMLNIAGSYTANEFILQSDGLGGTRVELPCFVAGTRVMTPDGPIAVELLSEGDDVVTSSGEIQTIRWIGRRYLNCRRHPNPGAVWPVRIRQGAFGHDRPVRDLFLSPDHAIYTNGVLVPVKYLLNGTTVRQMRMARVTYYHLELAAHDIVLAEGLPTETFLDTGNRGAFANAPGAVDLHPDFDATHNVLVWEAQGYAPLCITGPSVDAARMQLEVQTRQWRRMAGSSV